MKLQCPQCETELPADKMDINSNEAVCPRCGERSSISELLGKKPEAVATAEIPEGFDLRQPPPGVRYENDVLGWQITATIRSWTGYFIAIFTVVFALSTLVIFFGLESAEGDSEYAQIFLGIPFVIATLFLAGSAVLLLFGKTVIHSDAMDQDIGLVFFGVGPLGWKSRFRWSEVKRIEETDSGAEMNDKPMKQITLFCDRGDVHFGTLLSAERRRYILFALRQLVG
ncbi:hypothetical protein DTL42_00060 [Bremerella cremea]|uniref:Uncharacterized protein n=1 Tax=Bremerella cremea TaxID=1031537 RepID=A0A368KZ26_9BACT|nr:hypothetical protein [Bremerella cremea]RCS56157.1 hypothetical protein DTL42_00060 [Bremerella cremea]